MLQAATRLGETIYKGHRSYDLMLNLQLGIRHSVQAYTKQPPVMQLDSEHYTHKVGTVWMQHTHCPESVWGHGVRCQLTCQSANEEPHLKVIISASVGVPFAKHVGIDVMQHLVEEIKVSPVTSTEALAQSGVFYHDSTGTALHTSVLHERHAAVQLRALFPHNRSKEKPLQPTAELEEMLSSFRKLRKVF